LERQGYQAALRVSLEKYRVLFESFPLGIAITDEEGHILETNAASARLLGVSVAKHLEQDIAGPEWQVVRMDGSPMPPDEYASVRALREGQTVANVGMGIVKGPHDVTWINVTAAPVPLPGYGVATIYGDISERVRLEAVTQAAQEAVAVQQEHLRQATERHAAELQRKVAELEGVLDVLPVGVAIAYDAACRQVLHNRSALTLFGWPEKKAGDAPAELRDNLLLARAFRDGRKLMPHELPLDRAAQGMP
jgi:PAS domain S-box-containing protein